MSGAAAIRYLLAADSTVTALVPATSIIVAATVRSGRTAPFISVSQISGVPRTVVRMTATTRMVTERVQVMVHAKNHKSLRSIMDAVRWSPDAKPGTVNGIKVDSIIPEIEGPDLSQPDAGLFEQAFDFMVKWIDVSP